MKSNLVNHAFCHRFLAACTTLSFVTTNVVATLPQLLIAAGTASFSPAAAAAVEAIPPLPLAEPNAAIVSDGLPNEAAASAGGVTSGGLSVTAGGVATYAIPLRVPAGRAGYAPSVAINFSGAAGNGPLGVGFSVAAAGAISRCDKTLALDGIARGVQVDDQDNLCLNGRKLVAISGDYWGEGAVYRTQPDTWRTGARASPLRKLGRANAL